ncbi:MazG nucleotide pyrophosphohydrolase domain-containing protein, partial [Bifidobacterium longum]
MSKMSDMTEYHASAYRLPSGFEHCSELKPVVEAVTAPDRVKAVVDVLYSPGGCPWDGKQTNESLLKNLLEETYEYVDAVETHDRDNMREE